MPNFQDYIFNAALNLGSSGIYVGIVNNSTLNAYKAGPTTTQGLFAMTAVPAGLYTVYTSPTGSGLPPGGDWVATGETNYVVNPASPVANTDLAGPLLNAVTAGANVSVGAAPGGVGSQSVALIANPTLSGLLTAQAALTLTGLLTMLDAASRIVPGATSFSLRNNANNADNLLMTDAGAATVRNGLTVTAGAVAVPDLSFFFRKFQLQNNVSRVRSHQTGLGTVVITTAGTWYNYGAAVTITPDVASLIMAWGVVGGAGNVSSTLYARLQFNAGNGDSGGLGAMARDDTTGYRSIPLFDTFVQGGQGAVTIQVQLTADNNTDTFTPRAAPGAQLELLVLAIPST